MSCNCDILVRFFIKMNCKILDLSQNSVWPLTPTFDLVEVGIKSPLLENWLWDLKLDWGFKMGFWKPTLKKDVLTVGFKARFLNPLYEK